MVNRYLQFVFIYSFLMDLNCFKGAIF